MTINDKIILDLINSFDGPIESIRKTTKDIVDTNSDLLHVIYEAKISFPTWKLYLESLIHKIIFASYSLVNLSNGYTIEFKNTKSKIIDYSSMLILTRALIENYLTLYYIYISEAKDSEKLFKFKLWELSGLITRQGYDFPIKEGPVYQEFKNKKDREKIILENLLTEIKSYPEYSGLGKKEINKLKKFGLPRIDSWQKMIEASDLKKSLFTTIYSLSSNYAHSEFLGIMQIKQGSFSANNSHTIDLAGLCLIIVKIINSMVIEHMSKNFKSVELIYNAKPFALQKSIEISIKLGKKTCP